jgi:hypothetical protein
VDAYLCSAKQEGGSVPAKCWRACARDYLSPQLRLLQDRPIVALGRKAQGRVGSCGVPFIKAFSVAPPGCNYRKARPSWEVIPDRLNEWRATR